MGNNEQGSRTPGRGQTSGGEGLWGSHSAPGAAGTPGGERCQRMLCLQPFNLLTLNCKEGAKKKKPGREHFSDDTPDATSPTEI